MKRLLVLALLALGCGKDLAALDGGADGALEASQTSDSSAEDGGCMCTTCDGSAFCPVNHACPVGDGCNVCVCNLLRNGTYNAAYSSLPCDCAHPADGGP